MGDRTIINVIVTDEPELKERIKAEMTRKLNDYEKADLEKMAMYARDNGRDPDEFVRVNREMKVVQEFLIKRYGKDTFYDFVNDCDLLYYSE